MKQQTIAMPIIGECIVTECAYNNGGACNARAITVGDGARARCDTFVALPNHTPRSKTQAGVGACKATSCRHNNELECTADLVQIGRRASSAECLTFTV